MKNAWKITGWYVFALGITHNVVGFIVFWDGFRDMWNAGLFNSAIVSEASIIAFWFEFLGFFLMYLGWHWKEQIKRYKEPLSKFTAWGMTALTLIMGVFEPVSGFILMIPLCIIMLHPHLKKAEANLPKNYKTGC